MLNGIVAQVDSFYSIGLEVFHNMDLVFPVYMTFIDPNFINFFMFITLIVFIPFTIVIITRIARGIMT